MRQRGRERIRMAAALLALVAVAASVVGVGVAPGTAEAQTPALPVPAPLPVTLTPTGFVPDRITVVPGQTIDIVNGSGATRTITSGDGTFDSGPVAPSSRFVLALPTAGTWVASDDSAPTPHAAVITVGIARLTGDQFTAANSAIPELDVPDGPVVFHPDLGIEVARNRILVGFTASATVPQANAALGAAGLTILGGNRDAQILVTEVADAGTPGLEYMQSALDRLRTQPGVRTAAYDLRINPETALPRPADPDPLPRLDGTPTYTWEPVVGPGDTILGNGSNYGLESARFPQAWNWLDAMRRVRPVNAATSATVVLDSGFDAGHPDLANAKLQTLCTAANRCTTNPTGFNASSGRSRGEHGTAVAGVVGAVFDRGPSGPTSQGTVGGDPMSDLHLVPYFTNDDPQVTSTVALWSFSTVLDLIIDEKAKGSGSKFPNLRVINLSTGIDFPRNGVGVPRFENVFAGFRCGPGDSDDLTAPLASRVACTPNTYDPYIREFRAAAELLRPTGTRLANSNVLLVVAAGNDGDKFCAEPRTGAATACNEFVPVSATTGDTFGHLAVNWTGGPPPFVLVEANTATVGQLTRSSFSNVDGQLSAGGETAVPTVTSTVPAGYRSMRGTSFSAPLVSAAAGLLSSLPNTNWQTVRSLLVDRGAVDVPGSPTPRLDVFASLLGLPAATGIDALLDVNDQSADGNRRVTYDDRGQRISDDNVLGSTQLRTLWAAPDTNIDMRDFRRFRDAFLDACGSRAGCPTPEQISLDGPPTHPKRDQNLDRCLRAQNIPRCNQPEDWFSRLDFNGDGSLFPSDFPVLLRPDGTPAPRGSGTRMTDLDVFQTRFGQGPAADREGWTAADLDRLISSADIELRLDRLWAQGALSVEVTAGTLLEIGPRRTFTPRGQGDVRIYTVPIRPTADLGNADTVQLRAVVRLPGGRTAVYLSDLLPAKAGQDLVVVPCTDQFVVEASPPETTPGGSSLITARLKDCAGGPRAGQAIDFEIATGPNGSSISVVSAVTDASGVARTVFSYPDGVNSAAQVVAYATPALDGGERLQARVDLGPAEELVVHYRFRQTILEYERTSTNDWGPGRDDCDGSTDAGVSPAKCFTATQEIRTDYSGPGSPAVPLLLGELERRGTITPSLSGGAVVDDSVRVLQRASSAEPGAFNLPGVTLTTRVEEWDPATPANRVTRIYDSPIEVAGQPGAQQFADLPAIDVPTIDFAITPDKVRVNNLRRFGDGYAVLQSAYTLQRGVLVLPETTNPDLPIPNPYQPLLQIPTDLALVPRPDSSNFAWDWDPDAPLDIVANGDGTYQPTSWCGTRQRVFDNAADPGFWNDADPAIETTNPFDPNIVFPGPYRDPDEQRAEREPGDRAAPRHDGSVTSRFEFVAVVTDAGAPTPNLEFGDCEDTDPAPVFGWQPDAPFEGETVEFVDLSSYADTAQGTVWRFNDPAGVASTTNTHRFSDNGTYGVDFTVTDSAGVDRRSRVRNVVVRNAPPTLGTVEFLPTARRIRFEVDDPGLIDRQLLEVRLTSPTPGWPAGGAISYTAPPDDPATGTSAPGSWTDVILLPQNLAPGVYFVVLTVLDKDGGTATKTFSLAVPVPEAQPAGFRSPVAQLERTEFAVPAELATLAPQSLVAQALPPTTSPPPSGPVPAFVVDRVTVATGELLTVRNATRTAGVPAAATLDPGDGRAPFRIGAGATVDLAYVVAGGPTLRVSGLTGSIGAASAVSVSGTPIPAAVVYEGVTTAPLGADAAVVARATQVGGVNLPGVVVRFTLGDSTVEAVTGSDGRASAGLRVTGALGLRELVVQVVPDGAPTSVPFTVTANSVPVAEAGGPYAAGVGSPLNLAGSASDADPGEQALLVYEWDLDGDGAFDDAVGPAPSLTADQVRTLLCAGTCDAGETATVALRVTDTKGGRSVDTATFTAVRDFALTINPASATLVPNANVSFTVSVVTGNGFTGPVTLTAPNLPTGITATFTPSTVTPNGTSLLNLTAGPTFSPANFALLVRGTSGSIVRETGTSVSLEFGLIPQCFGAVTGRVTDETGAGVPGVSLFGAVTGPDGRYSASGLALDPGNAPRLLSVSTVGSAFYPIQPAATVLISCGTTSTRDVSVLRRQFGAVTGTITGIDVDGSPLGPINGATFALNSRTGADGRYSFSNLLLGANNSATNFNVAASAPGYHSRTSSVQISAGTTSTLDIALQRICTADVRVRVLDQATGRAVPGARVDAVTTAGGTTDANGVAIIPRLGLGAPDNRPITRTIRAFTPTGISPQGSATKNVVLGRCGAVVPVDIAIPFPRRVEAPVNVLVVDDTGAPVQGARVRIGSTDYSNNLTGADGRTSVVHLLGIDVPPTLNTAVSASRSGLLSPPGVAVTLTEGQTANVTVTLLTRKFGTAEGTVRDRATGAPIAGVVVGEAITGPDGRYRRENIPLLGLNQPSQALFRATDFRTPRQFWDSTNTQVTVRADEVTTVPDLLMTRVCDPATVRGRVLNAVDRTPIEGASVSLNNAQSLSDLTDADGRFVIENVGAGTNNDDLMYSIFASKSGFLTATKAVTVSCAADIVVDFGRDGDGVGTIAGRVTDPDGNPVNQARVSTGFGGSARTDSEGRYTIADAPAGEGGAARTWTVRVLPPPGSLLEPAERTATVRRDETTTLDITLGTLADDPPVAASFSLVVDPGPTPITLAGADPTGDPLTFEVTVPPSNGTLSGTPPNVVYTPNTGFVGVDTITYVADDGPNTSAPAVIILTVRGPNQLPVARITGPTVGDSITVDEGTRVDLSAATSSDPDGSIVLYEWDLDADGAFDDDTGITADLRVRDDAVAPVGLRVTDDRGGVGTVTRTVTFRNVDPTLDLEPPFVTARSIELFGEVDDDGRDDTFTGTIDLGDGSGVRPLTSLELDGGNLYVEHTYAAGGVYTITVRICDDDGGCVTETTTATIAGPGNAAPTARITGTTAAPEGGTVSLSAATSSDPEGPIASYAWDLDGDGAYDDATGVTASLTRPDDAVVDVGVRVVDGGGLAGIRRVDVTFTNVDPVVAPITSSAIVAGGGVNLPGSFVDPGADDWTATIDWGDGAGPGPLALTGTTFTLARTFADPATYTVAVEVCDDEDGCGTTSFTVTVVAANRDPVAAINAPASTPEGSSAAVDGLGSTDPDGAVAAYAWDLDDDGAFDDATTPATSVPCVDDGTRTVRLRVTDDDGASGVTSATVTCVNVAPTVATIGNAALAPGGTFDRTGSFADPGADDWTATVDWGEGAGPVPLPLAGTGFSLSHVYATEGTFTVTVVVCDDEDECGTARGTVTVTATPPDPSADLSITKTHVGDFTAGAAGAYTIRVTNAGPDVATGVTVTDTLPAGMSFTGTASTGWSCVTGATVVCTLAGDLAIGAAPVLVLDVAVAADAPIGANVVTNRATVAGSPADGVAGNNEAADPTTIIAPPPPQSDLGATVTVDRTNPQAGDVVVATIGVANAGPDASGPVTVGIDLPAGVSFGSVVGPQGLRTRQLVGGWTCVAGPPVVCTTPDIGVGTTSQLVVRLLVGPAASGVLDLAVTVSSGAVDPDPSDNTAPVSLTVQQQQPTTTTPTTTTPTTTAPPPAPTTAPSSPGGDTTVPASTVPGSTVPAAPFGGQSPPPPDAAPGPDGRLPETGSDGPTVLTLALQVLAGGLVLVLLARRRPRRV